MKAEKMNKAFLASKISALKNSLKHVKEILEIAYERFFKNGEVIRADVLTFYTLLAIVPFVAVLFGIAKGFGFNKVIESQLIENFPLQEDILLQLFEFANRILERTQGSLVAGTGLIVLIWTISKVLGNIEEGFNEVWEVENSRPLLRKMIDYIAMVFLTPVAISIISTANIYFVSEIQGIAEKMTFGTAIILALGRLVPFFVIIFLFAVMYIIFPNKKIKIKSGILGGVFAGVLYVIIQKIYIDLQIGVVRYNAIYGSFSFIPLFLIWIRTSWIIVLIGAEISYAVENSKKYKFNIAYQKISLLFRKKIAISIMHAVTKRFEKGEQPYTAEEIAKYIKIPVRLVENILKELLKAGLVYEINPETDIDEHFAPAIDPSLLTVDFVIRKMESYGADSIPDCETCKIDDVMAYLEKEKNTPVRDLEINS